MRNFWIGVLFLWTPFIVTGQNISIPSLITTEGEALVFAAPDEIILTFTIEATEPTLEAAKQKNNEIFRSAYLFLQQQGIAAKYINAQFLTIQPKKVKSSRIEQEVGYFYVTKDVEISIRDVDNYETIVDGLVARKVYHFSPPNFVSRTMRKHKKRAFRKAIKNAKTKAIFLANELGQTIGTAYSIREIDIRRSEEEVDYFDSEIVDLGMEEDWVFIPGQLEVHVKVEVRFYLK